MDAKNRRWAQPISIGMPASGWMVIHGLLAVAVKHPGVRGRTRQVALRLRVAIEDVLHEKGLLTGGDIRQLHMAQKVRGER